MGFSRKPREELFYLADVSSCISNYGLNTRMGRFVAKASQAVVVQLTLSMKLACISLTAIVAKSDEATGGKHPFRSSFPDSALYHPFVSLNQLDQQHISSV
jgi:hypothetical protein